MAVLFGTPFLITSCKGKAAIENVSFLIIYTSLLPYVN
jgi:hypothetical protein